MQNDSTRETSRSKEYTQSSKVFNQRMKIGFTQRELADKAGVTQKTISRIEGGALAIRKKTIEKVYEAMGMKTEEANDDPKLPTSQ